MVEVLKYTLEAGIIFCVFQFFFNQVYCSLCYNKWNRIYLTSGTFLSYLLPLLKVRYFEKRTDNPNFKILDIDLHGNGLDVITISEEQNFKTIIGNFFDSAFFEISVEILFAVYVAGVAVKLFIFFRGLNKTLKLKRNPLICTLDNNIKVFDTQLNVVAFSFFSNIFLGQKAKTLSKEDLETVFSHEKQHIKNLDSVDSIIFGLFSALQWFNPCLKKAVVNSRLIAENIADSGVSSQSGLTEYSRLLLRLGEKNVSKIQEPAPKKKPRGGLTERLILLFNQDTDKIRKIRFLSTLTILLTLTAAYILCAGLFAPQDYGYRNPIKGKFRISAGYFENKLYADSLGNVFEVSHPQIDFFLGEGSEIISPFDAVAKLSGEEIILKKENLEITIGGKNFFPVGFNAGDFVKEGEVLCEITEDNSLVYIKVTVNGKVIHPGKVLKL
ncbi:MAG: hypothetical protein IKO99_07770 [Bacteroidales bacterium]|nr:hypothetical protein [Bacteroidales bacterium]